MAGGGTHSTVADCTARKGQAARATPFDGLVGCAAAARPAAAAPPLPIRVHRLEHLERADQVLVDPHHRARVVKVAAIVWRGEDGDEAPVAKELVPIFHHLVRAHDQVEVVPLEEGVHAVGSKRVRDTAVVLSPARHVDVRVGPEQVAEQARVWHLERPLQRRDVARRDKVRRETAVEAKDALVDERGEGQPVEELLELLPQLDRVAALALVVEAVHAVDGGVLVVSAQQPDLVGVLDFERHQQEHALEPVGAAVDVVAEEDVARPLWSGGEAAEVEQPKQVRVLPMDVAHDLHRRLQLKQRRLAKTTSSAAATSAAASLSAMGTQVPGRALLTAMSRSMI
eukprot:CAMPEP_0202741702 /NCGR_PEP_ID=MMETSP1388-20130828/4496_1 /ASSEMBLY_ACC=CAM_ASM_000864 /TAXON_ID=37098 /ORGANISM="Isochrysis sp, Strain CCMP1244" /LENGTH=340 /DNA_ID=CAMNT_0049408555 /DNA_START=129 /DNA_END=1150 /DNA_ORIENTATION=-